MSKQPRVKMAVKGAGLRMRLDMELYAGLVARAQALGVSLSEYVRRVLEGHVGAAKVALDPSGEGGGR